MHKVKVKRDDLSLYIRVSGWIARPLFETTTFCDGEEVNAQHEVGDTEILIKCDGHAEEWQITQPYYLHPLEGTDKRAEQLRAMYHFDPTKEIINDATDQPDTKEN